MSLTNARTSGPGVGSRPLRLFVRPAGSGTTGARDETIRAVLELAGAPQVAAGPIAVLSPSGGHRDRRAFRDLRLLDSAHAMLVVRTAPSESGAYEVAYNVHAGPRIPGFFTVHRGCPMDTTLLYDLAPLVHARYVEFTHAHELAAELREFLGRCRRPETFAAAAARARLSAAGKLLRTLSERPDRDRTAMWWAARQATESASAVVAAAQAPSGPRQLDLLRTALGTARAAVETAKMAIYQTAGTRGDVR
ncbi:hypothetical protein ACFOSC_24510 [Streptantibioticus rubrisoli]|uniref:Uncharacterized protein n=1 Tax=Streptantibioticus rubrisoli TaxID=1387313 RepID=A0ABT1PBB5_9ACTN|nr:hypothetical protein [Streptantibioticus rubrisoli]MCQ4042665.1 hypothetical protein [Streptantibioticus rubrisoli]